MFLRATVQWGTGFYQFNSRILRVSVGSSSGTRQMSVFLAYVDLNNCVLAVTRFTKAHAANR